MSSKLEVVIRSKLLDILEIERNIIIDLEDLNNLLNEYEKLCNKQNIIISSKNWIRKKCLLKDIKVKIFNFSDNIELLLRIQEDQNFKLDVKDISVSNVNFELLAEKLIKITPKITEIEKTNVAWEIVPYFLYVQYLLTEQYNKKLTLNRINIQLKSILKEIKKKCKLAGLDYDMFLTRYHSCLEFIGKEEIRIND
jgi:hypothetical protein